MCSLPTSQPFDDLAGQAAVFKKQRDIIEDFYIKILWVYMRSQSFVFVWQFYVRSNKSGFEKINDLCEPRRQISTLTLISHNILVCFEVKRVKWLHSCLSKNLWERDLQKWNSVEKQWRKSSSGFNVLPVQRIKFNLVLAFIQTIMISHPIQRWL